MKVFSTLLHVAPVVVALLTADFARGQNDSTVSLKVSPADTAAQYSPGSFSFRALGLIGSKVPAPSAISIQNGSAFSEAEIPAIPQPGFYPADVSNPQHSPAVVTAEHHPLYVNMAPSHWGDVGSFLTDLGKSNFVHLLDQYVGTSANNRYTLGTSFLALYPIPANHTLKIGDILALVHAGAAIKGHGFGHIYHIFLPKGVDMCLSPISCYSPDNPPSWVFCAFHGAVTFSDAVGHVLFTVEPYQDVIGCAAPPTGTANSQLIDSTDDTLSHEVFELISDPDLNAWWVQAFTFANGNEIGDLCTRAAVFNGHFYSDYGKVRLNGDLYTIQPEYSNQFHGCAYSVAGEPE